jgi:hypothetical protein
LGGHIGSKDISAIISTSAYNSEGYKVAKINKILNKKLAGWSALVGILMVLSSGATWVIAKFQPHYPDCNNTFYILGRDENGVQCRASEAGRYDIEYHGGAYRVKEPQNATPGEGLWRTVVCVVHGDRPQWNISGHLACDEELFRHNNERANEVTQSAQAAETHIYEDGDTIIRIDLDENEVLTFLAKDIRNAEGELLYRDNDGEVIIEVRMQGQQSAHR